MVGLPVVLFAACEPRSVEPEVPLAASPTLEPMPKPTSKQRVEEVARGSRFWPRSAPLVQGVQYRFNTGHCGLGYLPDFDGSFWIANDPEGEVPDFFHNEYDGTLVVLSHERALFRAANGDTALLTRHDGPMVISALCR